MEVKVKIYEDLIHDKGRIQINGEGMDYSVNNVQ